MKFPRALLALILLLALVLSVNYLPVEQIVAEIQNWVDVNPSSAVYIITASVMLGTLLLLPTSLMMMLTGFLFGLAQGFVVVWIASLDNRKTNQSLAIQPGSYSVVFRSGNSKNTFSSLTKKFEVNAGSSTAVELY